MSTVFMSFILMFVSFDCLFAQGCSSVHFPRLIGDEPARKMLTENWVVTAADAKQVGLVTKLVPHEHLMAEAQGLAEAWIAEGPGRLTLRTAMGHTDLANLRRVNAEESIALGNAFVSKQFLQNQYSFLKSKGKMQAAYMFKFLLLSRPFWSKLL